VISLLCALLASLAGVAEERVDLRVGASVPVPGAGATVIFVRVRDDSRCPTGVTCIWEGDAIVELRLQTSGGGSESLELHANPQFTRQATVHGITIALERLAPHPKPDEPVPPAAYVATLRLGSR
jgi:hypothetical protein